MSKKIFVAVLAVALLGSAVGIGIHILHKDALAVVSYTIFCRVGLEGQAGLGIQFRFDLNNDGDFLDAGEGWQWPDSEGGGNYKKNLADWSAGSWQTRITLPDWVFFDTQTPVSELFAATVNEQNEPVQQQ